MEVSKDLYKALQKISAGEKHKYYDHTVKLAEEYRAMLTGEGLEVYLRRLKKRENKEDFAERIKLTEFINKSVSENLTSQIRELMRINSVHKLITYEEGEETQAVELIERFMGIHNEGDVNAYIEEELIIQSLIDPNSFAVLDKWEDEDGKEYPLIEEIPSKNIFNFNYNYKTLSELIVETTFQDQEETTRNKYHIYLKGLITVLEEVEKEGLKEFYAEEIEDMDIIQLGDKQYRVYLFPNELSTIPAFRIGFKSDIRTNRETKESFLDPAMPYLKKLVGSVSEYDLANLKHAFPRVFGYEKACPGRPDKREICSGGIIKTTGNTCGVCNGTGIMIPDSSLDSITLTMPKSKEDFVDLSKLMHTEGTDIELLRYMRETIKEYVEDAEKSIYGIVTLTKDEVTKTATEKIFEKEKISNALEPFAKAISKWWKKTHSKGAELIGMQNGLIIEHKFPRDLRVQTVSEMLDEIKVLKEGGADNVFIEAVQDEIAQKRFIDKPTALTRYRVYREHKPFNGDSETQIQYKITNGLVTKEDEILWANFMDIMEAVESEAVENGINFFEISKAERKVLVKEKVQEYLNNINGTTLGAGLITDGLLLDEEISGQDIPQDVTAEAEAKAKLKGTVGGVQGIIQINQAVARGEMTEASAEVLLGEIYGFSEEIAGRLIEKVQNNG